MYYITTNKQKKNVKTWRVNWRVSFQIGKFHFYPKEEIWDKKICRDWGEKGHFSTVKAIFWHLILNYICHQPLAWRIGTMLGWWGCHFFMFWLVANHLSLEYSFFLFLLFWCRGKESISCCLFVLWMVFFNGR